MVWNTDIKLIYSFRFYSKWSVPKNTIMFSVQISWCSRQFLWYKTKATKKDGWRISSKMERLPGLLRFHDGVPVPDRGNGGLHHFCRNKEFFCTPVRVFLQFTQRWCIHNYNKSIVIQSYELYLSKLKLEDSFIATRLFLKS